MKQYRTAAFLLLLTLLLSSCGVVDWHPPKKGETETEPTSETVEPYVTTSDGQIIHTTLPEGTEIYVAPDYEAEAKANLGALPDKNLSGTPFVILTEREENVLPDLSAEEENASAVSVAIAERNSLVTEKYKVTLLCTEIPAESFYEKVEESSLSGIYLADLIELPCDLCGILAANKLGTNMNSLPFTDYTKSYFDSDAIAQCSAGYFTYAVVGNANYAAGQDTCLLYNKALLSGAGYENLYRTVYDGKWTYDVLFSALTACGNSIAVSGSVSDLPRTVLASLGAHLLNTAYGSLPEAEENGEDVQKAVSLSVSLKNILSETEDALAYFLAGKLAFLLASEADLERMADSSVIWGVLPLPKGSEEQESYFTRGEYQTVYTAIGTMASSENTGLILQALNAASTAALADAYAEEALQNYLCDSESANMLALIAKNRSYDFSYMMQSNFDSIRRASVDCYTAAIEEDGNFYEKYLEQEKNLKKWNPKNFVWVD